MPSFGVRSQPSANWSAKVVLRLDDGFGVAYLPFSSLEVTGEREVISVYIAFTGREKNATYLYWFCHFRAGSCTLVSLTRGNKRLTCANNERLARERGWENLTTRPGVIPGRLLLLVKLERAVSEVHERAALEVLNTLLVDLVQDRRREQVTYAESASMT